MGRSSRCGCGSCTPPTLLCGVSCCPEFTVDDTGGIIGEAIYNSYEMLLPGVALPNIGGIYACDLIEYNISINLDTYQNLQSNLIDCITEVVPGFGTVTTCYYNVIVFSMFRYSNLFWSGIHYWIETVNGTTPPFLDDRIMRPFAPNNWLILQVNNTNCFLESSEAGHVIFDDPKNLRGDVFSISSEIPDATDKLTWQVSPNSDRAWIIETCAGASTRIELDLSDGYNGTLLTNNANSLTDTSCTKVLHAETRCGESFISCGQCSNFGGDFGFDQYCIDYEIKQWSVLLCGITLNNPGASSELDNLVFIEDLNNLHLIFGELEPDNVIPYIDSGSRWFPYRNNIATQSRDRRWSRVIRNVMPSHSYNLRIPNSSTGYVDVLITDINAFLGAQQINNKCNRAYHFYLTSSIGIFLSTRFIGTEGWPCDSIYADMDGRSDYFRSNSDITRPFTDKFFLTPIKDNNINIMLGIEDIVTARSCE